MTSPLMRALDTVKKLRAVTREMRDVYPALVLLNPAHSAFILGCADLIDTWSIDLNQKAESMAKKNIEEFSQNDGREDER